MSAPFKSTAVRGEQAGDPLPFDVVLLSWRERRNPLGQFECAHGDWIEIDAAHAMPLMHGTRLIQADGRHVEVIAAEERLFEVTGRDLAAWARWLTEAAVAHGREPGRLLVERDARIGDQLRRLGAKLREISEPFEPDPGSAG